MSKRFDPVADAHERHAMMNGHHHAGDGLPPLTGAGLRTDVGNAERFGRRFRGKAIHGGAMGGWGVFDGRRWERDECNRVLQLAKEIPFDIWRDANAAFEEGEGGESKAFAKWANESRSAAKVAAMLALAKSEPGIPVRAEDLDRDPYLLNVLNGTVDLRTGELRDHDPADLITRLAPIEYRPDAEAPAWKAFLGRVLPSEELRGFFRRLVGFWLTGDVSEQILAFFYGTGANGKTTAIDVILSLLGDYAQQAAPDLLVIKRGAHPTELAELHGRRLVAAVETEADARLAESLVKQLTGGDRVRARFMRQDFFEFSPTHKVLLAANHKPAVRGTDHAMWRRIKLIPFNVTIPDDEQDKKLPEKLRAELPGVLAWAVRGCLKWQRGGLGEPDEVTAATIRYRQEQDVLGAFVDECCVVRPDVRARFKDLYAAYVAWCEESGEAAENKRRFGDRLTERGFDPDKGAKNASIRRGIALKSDREPPHGGGMGNPRDKGLPNGNPENPRKTEKTDEGVTQGYRVSPMNGESISHGGSYAKQGNLSNPAGLSNPAERLPTAPPRTRRRPLTEEEAWRVQRLVGQGMKPEIARAEVLGEGG